MSVLNKRFLDMGGVITGREALRKYPNPAFFERARPSMSMDEIKSILLRNCDETERIVAMLRDAALHAIGTTTKAHRLYPANKLHDFRVSLNMHGGERGRPYLWEE